jgi:hypothetical protein
MGIGEWIIALVGVGLLGIICLVLYRILDELNQIGTMLADLMEVISEAVGNKEKS